MRLFELLAQQSNQSVQGLTEGGWVVMTLSIVLVCGLTTFCIYRILKERSPSTHHHSPLDIDTHDAEDAQI